MLSCRNPPSRACRFTSRKEGANPSCLKTGDLGNRQTKGVCSFCGLHCDSKRKKPEDKSSSGHKKLTWKLVRRSPRSRGCALSLVLRLEDHTVKRSGAHETAMDHAHAAQRIARVRTTL